MSRTESITLRIDKELLDELRKESDEKMESLNTLTNQIIKSHIKWYSHAQRGGIIQIPRPLLATIMENMSDYEIRRIADQFRQSGYKETLLLMSKKFTLSIILELFDSWLYISKLRYTHESNDGLLKYVIHHEMGKKWSLFLEVSFQYLLQDLGIPGCRFTVADSTVVIELNI